MFRLLIVRKDGVTTWSGHTYTREELADETASLLLNYGRVEHLYLCRLIGTLKEPTVVKQYA